MAVNAGSSNTSSASILSSRQKRRRVQKLMEADAKEVELNKRVAESMAVRKRKIENEILSTTSRNPGMLPQLETSSESSGQSSPSSSRVPTRQLKKYCGVAFPEENTVDVVPKNWLIQKNSQSYFYLCMRPPIDNKKELQMLAKAAVEPEDGWVTHECELIHSSKSYARADAAVKRYQSENQSDNDLDMFSTDTEWSQHSRLHSTSSIYPPTTVASNEVFNVKCSHCSRLEKRIISLEQEVQSLKKILLEVKVTSEATLVSVQKLIEQDTPPGFEDFTQLTTVEELKAFNKKLSENDAFYKMTTLFSAYRGRDAHGTTRKIMSVLMSNDLARQYNWIGGSLKNSFQEFKLIIQLVAASVRHIREYAETPVTTIESWIARWLRYATDRAKNGNKSMSIECVN